MPWIPNPGMPPGGGAAAEFSGAKVEQLDGTEVPDNTGTALIWESQFYDSGGYWSAGDPTRITLPAEGIYHITCTIAVPPTPTQNDIEWSLQSGAQGGLVEFAQTDMQNSGDSSVYKASMSWEGELEAADWVELFYFQQGSTPTSVTVDDAMLAIHLVAILP